MNAQEIISSGILELYCTGLTSSAETADVERWAGQYPEVAAEIAAIQAGLEGYARSHAVAPAASVKEKIFAEINKGAGAPVINLKTAGNGTAKVFPVSSFWKYAAAASIMLLIGSLVFNYTLYNKYNTAADDLQLAQTELNKNRQAMAEMEGDMGTMKRKDAMHVALKSTDSTKENAARIYWLQNTGEVYVDPTYLPRPPQGMQYQLWGIVDGVPVSGGMITLSDGRTVHLQKMKSFGKAQAFAVSLEKAGPEQARPSKDIVVVGSI